MRINQTRVRTLANFWPAVLGSFVLPALVASSAVAELMIQVHPSSWAFANVGSGAPNYTYDQDGALFSPIGLSGSLNASAGTSYTLLKWDVTDTGATIYGRAHSSGEWLSVAKATLNLFVSVLGDGGGQPIRQRSSVNGLPGPGGLFTGVQVQLNTGFGNSGPNIADDEYRATYIWTDQDHFPGERENPRDYTEEEEGPVVYVPPGSAGQATTEEGPDVANDTTGGYLTSLPVDGDFGVTEPVYFGGTADGIAQPLSAGLGSTDYWFVSQSDLLFTSFIAPDGIPGDTSQILVDDGTNTYPYLPGTTFQFPMPVAEFYLRGLDPTAMPSDGPLPFVHGMTFDQAGAAIFLQAPLIPIPEPSTCVLATLGLAGILAYGYRRKRR